ncbi:hypothetical protein MTO98_26300 [Mucilaginibacter sp. SMC90]|uniref:hypothetical protein n=1 Tax=Mucilaginibacter sp. SMC90 TaxID=2929803 RepID=UPI001FB299CE|nr:hypothetical protein [Mucilaginibacter sp. SMC90]UOE47927.1 hypothetical protein MTO98_26300 [Mucilaginibacter sp. SMC90]
MIRTNAILAAGVTGTTFMTLFSYLVSLADGENFSEPERLGQLAGRLLPKMDKAQSRSLGWLGHYGVGLLFAMVYVELWQQGKLRPNLKMGLWLGALSGLFAVAIWKATFRLHPLPPSLSFNKYYLQLIPAHLIFAVFAGTGYQISQKINHVTVHQ